MVGCSAMKQTSIEVLKPAGIFVPKHIRKVVLVDNTISQPAHIGNHTYLLYWKNDKLYKKLDATDTIQVDSLGTSIVFNTANTLLETGYYDTVLVWDKTTADSGKLWTAQRLSGRQIQKIALETDADAVFSLDVYTYENALNMYVDPIYKTVIELNVAIQAKALWRFYDVQRNSKIKHQIVYDSLISEGQVFMPDFGLPSNEEMLINMAWKMGETSAHVMSPSWKNVKRVYFQDGSVDFKLANKHLINGDPEAFRDVMLPLYEHGKGKIKARAAFNLAFFYELTDDLNESKVWINRSIEVYDKKVKGSRLSNEQKIANTYLNVINKRIKENEDITKQLHIE